MVAEAGASAAPVGPITNVKPDLSKISQNKRKRKNAEEKDRRAKFKRGEPIATKQLPDRKLKGKLRYSEKLVGEAAADAAQADEWLLPSEAGALEAEGMERTWRFSQEAIVQEVGAGAARKVFDLKLNELGPYNVTFTRNGRQMLLGGRKGHLAVMDWQSMRSICELQVRETVRDVQFLHNEQYFAAAQKKYVYIYDKRGLEVHCLKDHIGVHRLDFLPYHFLLTSVGEGGILRYQDTSTGHQVAQHKTRLGDCDVMRHNPYNAVVSLGHANGTVSMWTPNSTTPVVKMLCHRGPVTSLAMDTSGRHMATAGADGQLKLWDLRMLKPLHAYGCIRPATALDISQRGMLAVGFGRRVQVWKDALSSKAQAPYMNHELAGGALRSLAFCPYEDVLSAGHAGGLSTLLVPGSGEPNFDSLVADPYERASARREKEVYQLLQKLQPEMIVLDPTTIGQVKREPKEVAAQSRAAAMAANSARRKVQLQAADEKSKMKGKNKPSRKTARKKAAMRNIVDEQTALAQEKAAAAKQAKTVKSAGVPSLEDVPRALHGFYKKTVI